VTDKSPVFIDFFNIGVSERTVPGFNAIVGREPTTLVGREPTTLVGKEPTSLEMGEK
jgi:hypothetical protein